MKRVTEVYFDGACGPVNPGGHATAGAFIRRGKKEIKLCRVIGSGPGMSNNVAEFGALILGLEYLLEKGWQKQKVICYGDSTIVVNSVTRGKVSRGLCTAASVQAIEMARFFPELSLHWIPREMNWMADFLAGEAYEEAKRGLHGSLDSEYLAVTSR